MLKDEKLIKQFEGKTIFLTGGTGSFGNAFVSYFIENNIKPKKLIIFSRDELKQFEMQQKFPTDNGHGFLRFFIGDVRDAERITQAMVGVDYVVHAAALKQVTTAEYNPLECIKTNIMGAENVIKASIYNKVKKVIALSTDKAANPINLYGTTKLASDKIFIAANHLAASAGTKFSVVRYGNVVGSRGSVIPVFQKFIAEGRKILPITDARMTRFWITLEHGIEFVIKNFDRMIGGEVFVPKIPSMKIIDMAKTMAPGCDIEVVGIRPGEKLHEIMIPETESRNTVEYDDYFVIQPSFQWWDKNAFLENTQGKKLKEGFEYSSDKNHLWLTPQELLKIISKKNN